VSTKFSGQLDVTFTMKVLDTGTYNTVEDSSQAGRTGGFPSISKTFADGTGANQAQKQYCAIGTLANASDLDLDLTNLTGRLGTTTFSKIKGVIIALTPQAGKKLSFQGSLVSNPIALWKASATADEDIHDLLVRVNALDGWTVAGGAKVIRLNNASGVTVRLCHPDLGQLARPGLPHAPRRCYSRRQQHARRPRPCPTRRQQRIRWR